MDKHAKEILYYLISGKVSTKYMNQYAVSALQECLALSSGKKDPEQRIKEIQEFCMVKIQETLWKKDLLDDGRESIILELMLKESTVDDMISWISNDRDLLVRKGPAMMIRKIVNDENSSFASKLAALFESDKKTWLPFLTETEAIRILLALTKRNLLKLKGYKVKKIESISKLQEMLLQ